MSEMRRKFFADWDESREENPNGLRDLVESTPPLMRDPAEDYAHLRAALPGEDTSKTSLYEPNPYSVRAPTKLRALLDDPHLSDEERQQVTDAFLRLKRLEDGKFSRR